MTHTTRFFESVAAAAARIDPRAIDDMIDALSALRARGGRLFILGVGGSAANASHAVNDFRKLCGIEAYAPTDNVSELSARTNDEGWGTVFESWLRVSRLAAGDAILILSVGGGDAERNVSPNIVSAIDLAKERGATVLGIVGRDGGDTARRGDHVIVVPTPAPEYVTPIAESFQAVIWHLIVSHPALAIRKAKWESVAP